VDPSLTARLKIHETFDGAGVLEESFVVVEEGGVWLAVEPGGRRWALPAGALEAVSARFGAPLDDAAQVRLVAEIDLPGGGRLRHVRHLAFGDVIARDYLVHQAADARARVVLATTAAGALTHLARAAAGLSRADDGG